MNRVKWLLHTVAGLLDEADDWLYRAVHILSEIGYYLNKLACVLGGHGPGETWGGKTYCKDCGAYCGVKD